jgi:sialate O-acetylesterase
MRIKRFRIVTLVSVCIFLNIDFCTIAQSRKNIRMPAIFCDNMVLQQGKPVPIWGFALPSTKLKLVLADHKTEVQADTMGKWLAYMPVMEAGGPYDLKIISLDTLIIRNVMIGEVWFASGQSNMNFSIDRPVNNSKQVIEGANYPDIREFRVPSSAVSLPKTTINSGSWKVCTPENVQKFSAVAYFFARYLHLNGKTAVGIIHSSFSGTPIEAWMSADYLVTHPDFKDTVRSILQDKPDWEALDAKSRGIDSLRTVIVKTTNNGKEEGVFLLNYDDSKWRSFNYPLRASKMAVPGYSLVWVRKVIEIPDFYMKKELYLDLGTVAESDITYFNGVQIGQGKAAGRRRYIVPESLTKKGKNIIAVRFSNEWGNGRIGNAGEHPTLYSKNSISPISLEGNWTYNDKIEPELPVSKVVYVRAPTGLFNGMVSPIIPYAIKGFLWYQGEGNSDRSQQYQTLFPLMVMDWRIHWKQGDLPFLFVQLPNYDAGWAHIREAQASLLNYPHTGMAVTIDVGDSNDLHPGNKETVGYRLYLAAKRVAYDDRNVTLGPTLKNYKISGDLVFLSFENTVKGLKANGSDEINGFMIAGEDKKFYPAKAVFTDKSIVKVYCGHVHNPVAIRYAWSGNPNCNLYDSAGLPCAPFRTDQWVY